MSAQTKRGGAPKNAKQATTKKPAHAKPSGNKQGGTWYADVCMKADGSGTVNGLRALGPITQFSDLLLPATAATPQTTLAAEQLIHLVEGWRYAAAATNAILCHANGPATHLAYYAELRAAMSLFAWSGIRIKQNAHYYLDGNGKKQAVTLQRTHETVWGLWKYWVQRGDVKALFNDHLKLHPAVSLGSVISSVQYVNASATLQSWGLDLWDASHDRRARNDVSYEAVWTGLPLTRMALPEADLIVDLWNLFLSDGSSLVFDSALANRIVVDAIPKLKAAASGLNGHQPTDEEQLDDVVVSISAATGVPEEEIRRRLDSSQYPESPFALASSSSTDVGNILCRGFFLLRMAMLAVKLNMNAAQNVAAKRWIENWLEQAGIWDSSSSIELFDLEADYKLAVDELTVQPPLPTSLWTGVNLQNSARLARPDACIAWALAV